MSYFPRPHGGDYDNLTESEYWQARAISVDGCKNYIVTMGADYWDWLEVLSESQGRPIEDFYRAATRSLFRTGTPKEKRGNAISISLAYEIERAFQESRQDALGYSNDDYWAGTAVSWANGDPKVHFAIPPKEPRPRKTDTPKLMLYCGYDLSAASLNVGCRNLAAQANDRPV